MNRNLSDVSLMVRAGDWVLFKPEVGSEIISPLPYMAALVKHRPTVMHFTVELPTRNATVHIRQVVSLLTADQAGQIITADRRAREQLEAARIRVGNDFASAIEFVIDGLTLPREGQ